MAIESYPTVAVENPKGGFMVINRQDFDPSRHRPYDASKEEDFTIGEPQDTPATENQKRPRRIRG